MKHGFHNNITGKVLELTSFEPNLEILKAIKGLVQKVIYKSLKYFIKPPK